MTFLKIQTAALMIQTGGVVAYPTEAVFGLGCDPFSLKAVLRLLKLKKRSPKKGLILISHSWEAFFPFLTPIPGDVFKTIQARKTPCTWILPANHFAPKWITVNGNLAVRVTTHPLAIALCKIVGYPIVSTSANKAKTKPARTGLAVRLHFKNKLDYILAGKVGGQNKPTPIIDPIRGIILRAGG